MLDDNANHYMEKYSVEFLLYTLKTWTEPFLAGAKGDRSLLVFIFKYFDRK